MPEFINATNITPPRVPLIDQRTGLISREWYRFFLNLFNLTGGGTNQTSLVDLQLGPPPVVGEDIGGIVIDIEALKQQPTQESALEQIAEINKQLEALASSPDPGVQELVSQVQKQIQALEMTPRPELGTMAPLEQDNVPWLTFNTAPSPVPTAVGSMYWDGGTTMGIQATANVLIRVGESEYVYVKASSAITKGQLCYHTGAVGASGVITAAPTPLALADPNQIIGVAAESIALNGFGLIQVSGDLRGFNTTGSSVGETWTDGDPLYYNPAYVGSMTKTKPSAPNQKTYIGEVINAATSGSGSMSIRIVPGSILGGTDSNVQFGTLANSDLIQYDSTLQYWKNVAPSTITVGTATNLAGGAAGSVPYQTAPGTTTFLPVGTALQVLKVNSGATAPEWVSGAALTKTDDTNVTLTLGGTPATSLLAATSLTLGWTGQLGLTRGGTNASLTASAGSVAYSTASALALNTAGSSGDWLKSAGTGAPAWTSPAALTKTDDTNVTLTLGGSASTSLLNAASITVGWTGQLAVSRGGTGVSTTPTDGQLLIGNGTGYTVANVTAGTGISVTNASGSITITNTSPSSGGTVTSVGLSMPTQFTVTNSPVTSSGTLTAAWNNQTANYVFAGPTTGAAAAPTFRALVAADIPSLSYVTSVSGTSPVVSSGGLTPAISLASGYGDTQNPYASKTANYVLAAPNGSAGVPTFRALVAADIPTLPYQPTAAPVTYTANFSVATTDVWIINNKSGSSCTATLPTASSYSGRVLRFQNYQAQTLVSASSNVVPVAGGAASTSILLASAGDQCTLVSDGTNWIMTQYIPNNALLLE